MADADDFQARVQRIDLLVQALEACPEEAARAGAREVVRATLELHRTGLARVLDLIGQTGAAGRALIERLAEDDLAGSLLLLHGLHPLDLEARVARAVERLRPQLRAQGGELELIGVQAGTVRLRLRHGASPEALRRPVEEALVAAAPDAETILVEEAPAVSPSRRLPLPLLGRTS
jgi:Fe-S cluster biogenesis protein NfuA